MDATIIDAGWDPGSVAVNDPAVDPNAGATSVLTDRVFHVVTDAIATVDVQMSNLTVMGGSAPEVTGLFNGEAIPVEYYLRLSGGGVAVGNDGAGRIPSEAVVAVAMATAGR